MLSCQSDTRFVAADGGLSGAVSICTIAWLVCDSWIVSEAAATCCASTSSAVFGGDAVRHSSFASWPALASGRQTAAIPRKRTQSQGIGICRDVPGAD